jgi:hypothetical protein
MPNKQAASCFAISNHSGSGTTRPYSLTGVNVLTAAVRPLWNERNSQPGKLIADRAVGLRVVPLRAAGAILYARKRTSFVPKRPKDASALAASQLAFAWASVNCFSRMSTVVLGRKGDLS